MEWSLEKLTGRRSRNPPHFMEFESSLQLLQMPVTCLYPELY